MKTIFETCVPRDEVLSGELRDEMYAARLKDVLDGRADSIYQEPRRFFENTYPTSGMRTLLTEVLGRLSGQKPSNSPFIRLETSFGGGKTHNLIALYHLANGHAEGLPADLVPHDLLAGTPWLTAGIVGSDMDPANGIDHGAITTRTLWGEFAWQLGGSAGYEHVRASDQDLVAPGTQVLERLIGDRPALLMLDEVARYLRTAKAVATANRKSDLAEQTVAFLMTLIEFAASSKRVVVVLTLADSKDAFGEESEILKVELAEARRVSARQERVITPTGEDEIARIVTHRLFRSVDHAAAAETASVYSAYYDRLTSQGVDLPQRVLRAECAAEMAQDYPFHPELLNTLTRKTATITNFQRTRGALRLLARVVRNLWDPARRPADAYLIAAHDIDVGLDDVAADLTSRLERPLFRSVIEADIVSAKQGSTAHCDAIDRRFTAAGKPPYARRTAINIFLHSLTQGIASGVDPAELLVSVLEPGDDPALVHKALALMLAEEKAEPGIACWFLHWDGFRYRFSTEPSLEKVIQEEIPMVGRVKAKQELDDRIRQVWKVGGALRPRYFPSEAAELDDDAKEPKLVILQYDAARSTIDAKDPPELVAKLFAHSGSMDGFRKFQNNVVFLVADLDQVDRMVDVVQRYRAVCRIADDAERMREFTAEQRKKLAGMKEAAELEVRVAITKAYRHLFYPSADAPKSAGGLSHHVLDPQDQGEVEKDQVGVLVRVLKNALGKILDADDPALPPSFLKAKAWPMGAATITTEGLRKEFAKRIGLKFLLDVNQLKKAVKLGVSQGAWIYYDSEAEVGYGKDSPPPLVLVSEDATLMTLDEAERLHVSIKGEEQKKVCPLCGKDPCACGELPAGDDGGGKKKPPLHVSVDGTPAQAFKALEDRFHDEKATRIVRLTIRSEGSTKEAASDARIIGLAIPQLGKGAARVGQRMAAQFGDGASPDKFVLDFSGAWDRYKRVKQLTDAFGQEASKVNVTTVLELTYADGLEVPSEGFHTLQEVFTQLGLGRVHVEALEMPQKGGTD